MPVDIGCFVSIFKLISLMDSYNLPFKKGGEGMDKQLSEIIDLAIQREEEAYDFYMDIFNILEDPSIKDTVEFIAKEEKKHKAFLVNYREGEYGPDALRMTDVVEYKISEYLEEPEITKETKREDVYLIASHREARSHRFYTELANMHDENNVKEMLLKMANEELKHKEKMEYLYANTAFPQTAGG
jgi:rubrerythrin